MKIKNTILCVSLMFLAAHCASEADSTLEEAQFELDQGNFDEAIELALDSIAEDDTNVNAYKILGSAFFGRSGLDFLDLEQGLLNLEDDDETNFTSIANVLPEDGNMEDVSSAIAALEAAPGIDATTIADEVLADTAFDLAFIQTIEHFAIGIYSSGFFGTFDVSGISDLDAALALTDLVNFDNTFVASGVDSEESFLNEIRQTFCILEPITAAEGFTTAEFQALVGCQLEPDTFDPSAITADIATCADLNPDTQTAGITACYDTDTEL